MAPLQAFHSSTADAIQTILYGWNQSGDNSNIAGCIAAEMVYDRDSGERLPQFLPVF
jgi:hypothetical protein